MNPADRYSEVFNKYVPSPFVPLITHLLLHSNVHFKIVKERSTKLGDFRPLNKKGKPQITVNGNLNPYAFLITTLHEFAHWQTFEEFGMHVAPHGTEWKHYFSSLIAKIIHHPELPSDLKKALVKSTNNPKASSCNDIHLSRVLRRYDVHEEEEVSLENLPKNTTFVVNSRIFRKGEKRRTRFECKEISTGKMYLVHLLAKVKPIYHDK
jgi:predicted SprT family Zn-dependent metalloprotease